jgi:hypothetical protein
MEDPAWDGMQNMFLIVELEGVTGIGSTLEPGNYIIIPRERIDQFALTLIAPLQAEQNIHFHHELY